MLVAEEIQRARGRTVANGDSVATVEGGESIMQTAISAFGRLDVVVNNAGILRDWTLVNMSPDDWRAVLSVHLDGAYNVTRPALRAMREQGYGRIIFATSNAGLFGIFGQSNYAAAKAGLVGLCKVVALEGRKYGVKANVIAPIAQTRMTETFFQAQSLDLDPQYVVPLAVYLASCGCDVSGRICSAAGGRYARAFTALTAGWYSQGVVPSAEQLAQHFETIDSPSVDIVPDSIEDELESIARLFAANRVPEE